MAEKSWGDLLRTHSSLLDEQNRDDFHFLSSDSALSSREKFLLALALDSMANKPNGAKRYGEEAVKAGASKGQILDALTIVRMFAGRGALATGCEALRQFES